MRLLLGYLGGLPRWRIALLCVLLEVLVGLADYWAHLELSLDLVYLVPVSVAAWFLGPRRAVMFSLLGAATWFAADYFATPSYSHPIVPYWNTAVILGFLLLTVAALTGLRVSAEHEMELAKEIQSRLVPERPPHLDGIDLAWQWRPADAIGGDYFDVLPFEDGSLGLCVADAIGHGIPAALMMANLQAAVRTLALSGRPPAELCGRLNTQLHAHLPAGKFVTLWYGVFSEAARTLAYSNAGHNPPLLLSVAGAVVSLDQGGPILGIRGESVYAAAEVRVEPGSRLVLFTDGVVETRNREGIQFGLERLIDVLSRNRALSARDLIAAVDRELTRFSDRIHDDDLTILVVAFS
jgi:serine phosphatase RsbU (regulator of sigma subunit)